MIRFWLHLLGGHRASIPGAGYRWFYYCRTCTKGWGHRCSGWCGHG